MAVKWAPLNIPLKRRLETLTVVTFLFIFVLQPVIAVIGSIICLFTPILKYDENFVEEYNFSLLTIAYYVWVFYDRKTPKNGGRPNKWYRRLKIWDYFVDYFPIKLVKTVDLPPKQNYLIGSHPHGIFAISPFGNFSTESTGFSDKYPGITPLLVTLPSQFYWPLKREINLAHGCISSDADSIMNALKEPNKGVAAILVIGGADEALHAHPDNFDIKLATRKGFIKLALKTGAWLVPTYNFGENSIYHQVENTPGTKLRDFQEWFKNYVGFSPPIFFGRGIFQYTFGFMPYRKPLTTVVGAPIPVMKNDSPTKEDVNDLHEKYCTALVKLFEEHKTKNGISEDAHLNIY